MAARSLERDRTQDTGLNQAVKRNAERFPDDFRFQLTTAETAGSRSQSVTLNPGRGQNIKFLEKTNRWCLPPHRLAVLAEIRSRAIVAGDMFRRVRRRLRLGRVGDQHEDLHAAHLLSAHGLH
jgi:hypothetical protein